MMQVSNTSCGIDGWVCLDPDFEHLSEKVSERLFSFVLASKMAGKNVLLYVNSNQFSAACNGNYPVVEDVRTP